MSEEGYLKLAGLVLIAIVVIFIGGGFEIPKPKIPRKTGTPALKHKADEGDKVIVKQGNDEFEAVLIRKVKKTERQKRSRIENYL